MIIVISSIAKIFASGLYMATSVCSPEGAVASDKWPDQPRKGVVTADMGLFEVPPWFRGKSIMIKYPSVFFQNPIALIIYKKNPECLADLIAKGEAINLPPDRKVTALENIYSWAGRVNDKQYGDGYVMMKSSF